MSIAPPSPDSISISNSPFQSLETIALFLGTDVKDLVRLANLPKNWKYKEFTIPKRSGKRRRILAPVGEIKSLQSKIAKYLELIRSTSDVAIGYARGRSIFDHAARHIGKDWVLTIDLDDFFQSITKSAVENELRQYPINAEKRVAVLLAEIACCDDSLPQGSPLSPVLSNYYLRKIDKELQELANHHDCLVSRYADDICFSGDAEIHPDIATRSGNCAKAGIVLTDIFRAGGFSINAAKTKFSSGSDRRMITGLIVDTKVKVPKKWRRQLRTMIHLCNKFGPDEAENIIESWDKKTLRKGRIGSLSLAIEGKQSFLKWVEIKNREMQIAEESPVA